jgi:hypothetical protein
VVAFEDEEELEEEDEEDEVGDKGGFPAGSTSLCTPVTRQHSIKSLFIIISSVGLHKIDEWTTPPPPFYSDHLYFFFYV